MLLHVLYMFEIWHTKIIGQEHQILAAKFKSSNISENEYGKIERKMFSQQRVLYVIQGFSHFHLNRYIFISLKSDSPTVRHDKFFVYDFCVL